MKTLTVFEDRNGNIVLENVFLNDIEKLDISPLELFVLLKTGFSRVYSLIDNGFGYSFKIG